MEIYENLSTIQTISVQNIENETESESWKERKLDDVEKDKTITQTKMALSLMQAISGVAFSLQVGYLVMKEPWLSFTMFMGFTYILAINAVFFLGIRFLFPNRMKDVLLQNKIASGVEIGLLHLAWAIVTLGSMASRY